MEQKNSPIINLTDNEVSDIKKFCKLNNLEFDKFIYECFKSGYYIEKYGTLTKDGKIVIEKEVIREVVKEVPVEVIKEVIREVPVEKKVVVNDTEKMKELQETILKLSKDIRDKEIIIKDLEKKLEDVNRELTPKKVQFLRSSNLNDIGK